MLIVSLIFDTEGLTIPQRFLRRTEGHKNIPGNTFLFTTLKYFKASYGG